MKSVKELAVHSKLRMFKNVIDDHRGATAIEYALILALIFLAAVGAMQGFGQKSSDLFDHVTSTIEAVL